MILRSMVQVQTDKNLDYKTDHENTKKKKKSSKVKSEIHPKWLCEIVV